MGFLDAILNVAGLLLWLNWRSHKLTTNPLPGKSLLATLKRTDRPAVTPKFLLFLMVLLLIRALFYWQIGGPLRWAPSLQLGAAGVFFRSDYFGLMLLYSLLGFLRVLAAFHLWLLLLSVVNRRAADGQPLHGWIRIQLGWMERLPVLGRLVLGPLGLALLWSVLQPLFAKLALVPPTKSFAHLAEQSLVMGVAGLLTWPPMLAAILGLHLVNSYVHLGAHTFWNYVNLTARNLLCPLAWIPLRIGRVDFTPGLGLALVVVLGRLLTVGLIRLYDRLPL